MTLTLKGFSAVKVRICAGFRTPAWIVPAVKPAHRHAAPGRRRRGRPRRVAVPARCRISRNARSIVAALIANICGAPPAPAASDRAAPLPRLGSAAVAAAVCRRSGRMPPRPRSAPRAQPRLNPTARPRTTAPAHLASPQQTHRMLTMKPGHCRELVQNATTLSPIPLRIPSCYRRHQLVSRRHADPPHP